MKITSFYTCLLILRPNLRYFVRYFKNLTAPNFGVASSDKGERRLTTSVSTHARTVRSRMRCQAHVGMALPSEEFQMKAELILNERSKANLIIDFLQILLSENEDHIGMAVDTLQRIFDVFMERGELPLECMRPSGEALIDKYKLWLHDQYLETKSQLIMLLTHSSKTIQKSSASALVTWLSREHQICTSKECTSSHNAIVKEITGLLLSSEKDNKHAIAAFCDSTLPVSYKTEILKAIILNLKDKAKKIRNPVYMINVYSVLRINWIPRKSNELSECDIFDQKNLKIWFSKAWVDFLKLQIPFQIYKRVLIDLHEIVLPNMKNPVILTDFLTESYGFGGAISLLALNGIFFLIQNYNLEYPNFYEKLYALLTEDIFNAKYRPRFFYLMDIFLSSTHLPAYLVAAFVKKLSYLALVAPPDVLLIILPFMRNLIIRHPSLRVMLNRSDKNEVSSDPYLPEETDLSKCRALESSLWEIKSLQNHWNPLVSKESCFVNKSMPPMEKDLAEIFETNFSELFEKEMEGELQDLPLSFDSPKALFIWSEDKMSHWWTT